MTGDCHSSRTAIDESASLALVMEIKYVTLFNACQNK